MDRKKDQMDRIPAWQELPSELEGPLYERIAEYIRMSIREGKFHEGQKLPSKRSLKESLGVSLTTINSAYDILTAEGYLVSYPRSCYRVGHLADLYLYMSASEEIEAKAAIVSDNDVSHRKSDEDIDIRYDFNVKGVDESLFQEKMVKRIYKRIIDEGALTAEPEARGLMSLRIELANNLYSTQGIKVNPDNIIISYGTMGLFRFLFELLPSNTVYGIEDPGFKSLAVSLKRSGRRFHYLPIGPQGISTRDLENKGVDVACVTPTHQFPTGIEYSTATRQELLKWAYDSNKRFLIEDDYDGLIRHRRAGESLKKLDQAAARVLYIGNFSRSWSPGLRISYVCLTDELSRRAYEIGIPAQNPVPLMEQSFLEELIRSHVFERHLNRARRLYRRKRRKLIQEIKSSKLPWQIQAGPAGLHITCRFLDGKIKAQEFVKKAREEGIKLQSLADYCFDIEMPETILIGFGRIDESDIEAAVRSLEQVWFNMSD